MISAPIPKDEQERLAVLKSIKILDTVREECFDKITREASEKLRMPISTISIIDDDREWYKSTCGLGDIKEGDRSISFCGHALVNGNDIFIVEDTLNDSRFFDNPHVINYPNIRFYAGVRLFHRKSKMPVGVFCVKDTKPRKLSIEEISAILDLALRSEEELNKERD